MTIKEILTSKANEYTEKYLQWLKENPGYVMCNYAIKEAAAIKLLNECDTIADVVIKQKEYSEKYKTMNGMNGWGVSANLCSEIIKIYEEGND